MGYKRFITVEGEDYDATLIQSMNIGQVKMLCSFVDNERDLNFIDKSYECYTVSCYINNLIDSVEKIKNI